MGYIGIFASAAAAQGLGFIWYGPVFGSVWCSNNGRRREDMKTPSSLIYLIPAASKAITAGILSHVLKDHLAVTDVQEAMHAAIPLSIILALYQASHAPFLGIRLPALLIDIGYDTICTVLTAVLVTAF